MKLKDGSVVDSGRVIKRHRWNLESYALLRDWRQSPDIWIDKNRLSGFWWGAHRLRRSWLHAISGLYYLRVQTLIGAWVAVFKMLLQKVGTAHPRAMGVQQQVRFFAKQCIEFNCAEGWGFVLSCKDLAKVLITCRKRLAPARARFENVIVNLSYLNCVATPPVESRSKVLKRYRIFFAMILIFHIAF